MLLSPTHSKLTIPLNGQSQNEVSFVKLKFRKIFPRCKRGIMNRSNCFTLIDCKTWSIFYIKIQIDHLVDVYLSILQVRMKVSAANNSIDGNVVQCSCVNGRTITMKEIENTKSICQLLVLALGRRLLLQILLNQTVHRSQIDRNRNSSGMAFMDGYAHDIMTVI